MIRGYALYHLTRYAEASLVFGALADDTSFEARRQGTGKGMEKKMCFYAIAKLICSQEQVQNAPAWVTWASSMQIALSSNNPNKQALKSVRQS